MLGASASSSAPVAPAAVVPTVLAAPTTPPKPPPPPPRVNPYFARSAATRQHYGYAPPPAQHVLVASAPRIQVNPATLVAPLVDLRAYALPVRDGLGAGYSTAAFREVLYAAATGMRLPDYLAPAYLRTKTPPMATPCLADELLTLVQYGICPEAFLPDDASPLLSLPAADVAASMFRVPAPPPSTAQPGLVQVDWSNAITPKVVLAAKQPILISFIAYESFDSPDRNGVVQMFDVSEPVMGAIDALVLGYDDVGWIVRQHRGTDFGADGYVTMPFGYEATWLEAWTSPGQA